MTPTILSQSHGNTTLLHTYKHTGFIGIWQPEAGFKQTFTH